MAHSGKQGLNLAFVPLQDKHFHEMYRWRSQKNMVLYNPIVELGFDEFCEVLRRDTSDFSQIADDRPLRLAVEKGGELVGNVALNSVNSRMQTATIGYSVAEEFYGQRIGSQMVGEFVDRVWKESALRKLVAFVHVDNQPSRRILENAGFSLEGLLREHFLINGKAVDEALYGLLRPDAGF